MSKIIIFINLIYTVSSIIIASSNITQCFNQTNCTSKLFISLTLENNQLQKSESLNFSIKNFTDSSGNFFSLSIPVQLTVTKSPVQVVYAVNYLQEFSINAFETQLPSNWPYCSEGILALNGTLSQNSTCGFTNDPQGNPIPYSGGFCCTCPTSALLTGLQNTSTRDTCTLNGNSQYANCLKFNSTNYSGFSIGGYFYDYNITTNLTYINPQTNTPISVITNLSPYNLQANNGILHASVIGSFLPIFQPPTLTGMYLLSPSILQNPLNLTGNKTYSNWLVVNSNQITFDGSECNKIGVGYSAFKNQNNACNVSKNSCLANQITNLINNDLILLTNNRSAQSAITRFGSFNLQGNNLIMAFNSSFSTAVSIQITASQMSISNNLGIASIYLLEISDFDPLFGKGSLAVGITNNGTNADKFEIDMFCQTGIQNQPSIFVSLNVSNQSYSVFQISPLTYNLTVYTCGVNVLNSYGLIVASQNITFQTISSPFQTTNLTSTDPLIDNSTLNTSVTNVTVLLNDTQSTPNHVNLTLVNNSINVCANICDFSATSICYLFQSCGFELKLIMYYSLIGFIIFIVVFLFVILAIPCLFKRCKEKKASRKNIDFPKTTEEEIIKNTL